MRRAASRIFATSLLFLGFGCASPSTLGGSGGGNGSGNGGSPGNGGSNPGAGGSNPGAGGTHSSGNGGSNPGTGGTHTGGGGAAGPACTPTDSELVNANAYYCTSSALGMQGSIYPYGDGMSCPYSPTTPPATNFCMGGKCCLAGTTKVDTTFAAWGCGIGVELDDVNMTKMPYAGSVNCFQIKLTGSSGGNSVQIGFTQSANPPTGAVAPFTLIPPFTDGYSGKVCFSDATCPAWATAAQCAKTGTNGTPVDMQIQINGGSTAGAYSVCLTSIAPITGSTGAGGSSGGGTSSCATPGGSGTISDQFGAAHVSCPKDYIVQNNDWGVSTASQTLNYGPGTKFKVATQNGTGANHAPASYPSIFTGIGGVGSTTGSGLPLAVSSISATGISTSWTFSNAGVSGSYNAAYDVWFSTSAGGDSKPSAPSGGYLMVWFYIPNDNQPVGSLVPNGSATIGGKTFNIWYGTNSGKPVVSYVPTSNSNSFTSWTYPLGAFIQDAAGRNCSGTTKCISSSWYLETVYAGFEIWSGGTGLQTTDFGVTVP
jgi:Glycosyl hydrolase family 12